jgi:hypothetical protein
LSDEAKPKKKKPKKRRAPKARRSGEAFRSIDAYAEWCRKNRPAIRKLTLALTERYTRTILGLRAKDPLFWKGLELTCIGSPAVRVRSGPIR